MKFELSFNEEDEENKEFLSRMGAAGGVMVGLDIIYYAFVSNSIGHHFDHVTRTRMLVGLFIKWVLLSFVIAINVSEGMYDALLWGAVVGFVIYAILNAFTQAIIPEIGKTTYPLTNVVFGTLSTVFASLAAFYINS